MRAAPRMRRGASLTGDRGRGADGTPDHASNRERSARHDTSAAGLEDATSTFVAMRPLDTSLTSGEHGHRRRADSATAPGAIRSNGPCWASRPGRRRGADGYSLDYGRRITTATAWTRAIAWPRSGPRKRSSHLSSPGGCGAARLAVIWTARSSNTKTGPMPVSTISSESCPDDCPLRIDSVTGKDGPATPSKGRLGFLWRTLDGMAPLASWMSGIAQGNEHGLERLAPARGGARGGHVVAAHSSGRPAAQRRHHRPDARAAPRARQSRAARLCLHSPQRLDERGQSRAYCMVECQWLHHQSIGQQSCATPTSWRRSIAAPSWWRSRGYVGSPKPRLTPEGAIVSGCPATYRGEAQWPQRDLQGLRLVRACEPGRGSSAFRPMARARSRAARWRRVVEWKWSLVWSAREGEHSNANGRGGGGVECGVECGYCH